MILIVDGRGTVSRLRCDLYGLLQIDTALISAIKILRTQLFVSVRAYRIYLRNYVSLSNYCLLLWLRLMYLNV